MTRALAILIVLLGYATSAFAVRVLETVEGSAELTLAELELPLTESGSVSFMACPSCRTTVRRVTTGTKYLVDGNELTLADFLAFTKDLRRSHDAEQRAFVGVYYDLQSLLVTRIALHTPK